MAHGNRVELRAPVDHGARSQQKSSNGEATEVLRAESAFAHLLAEVLSVDHVPVESDFFQELGADSLLMARFCARVRKRGDLPSVSIRDVYQYTTIRDLAVALVEAAPAVIARPAEAPSEPPARASTLEYVSCGVLQLASVLAYTYAIVRGCGLAYDWISVSTSALELYTRLVACGAVAFVSVCTVPVLLKWLVIGRWKAGQIRIWSFGYFRFWFVKTLIRSNPCALLFVGSPLYNLYLRALGARIGPGAAVFTRRIPVCTDLLTVGAGAVVRKEVFFQCYRAVAGRIEMGPVTLGRDTVVSERSVLDIHTSMGDGAQLGHASALISGQTVPAGESWHGSPAQRADVDYLRVAPMRVSPLRKLMFCTGTVLMVLLVYLPFVQGISYVIAAVAPTLGEVLHPSGDGHTLANPKGLAIAALELSLLLYFGGAFISLLVVLTVPRFLNLFLVPDKVYPLYGFHDRARRAISRITNIKFFKRLFGDSSYVVPYYLGLGYRLKPVEQTGSNFGLEVNHGNPLLCTVGTGTMVADGLILPNDEVSATGFWVSRATIGAHNFVGNDVVYPAGGRTGENCLLGSKVMVPLDGKLHENTGLLGSPCFEIPRTVDRDTRFDHLREGPEFRRRLQAKNRCNLRTMAIYLLARWFGIHIVVQLNLIAFALYDVAAQWATVGVLALSLLMVPLYFALVERCLTGFRPLRPTICSIYDPYFWMVERLWKVAAVDYLHSFDGTAYKPFVWRLMGAHVGKRVYDDGVWISERSYTTIGDGCALNTGSSILCHSQEDGTFKADRTVLGADSSVGVGAMVHYGVTMGKGSTLDAESFLMKGEEVPAHARWGGNPAREL